MTEQKSIEERLTLLERFAEAVLVRQDGEDLLRQGVSRLSDETNALNAVLSKVDEQQQYLADLGKRTDMVEETAVSREELIDAHDQQEQIALEFRKRTLKRVYLTTMFITLGLVSSVAAIFEIQDRSNESRYLSCVQRNEQDDILHDILSGLTKNAPPESEQSDNFKLILEGIRRLEEQAVDCEILR